MGCMLLVTFWLIAGKLSSKPFKAFDLTATDFSGFTPTVAGMTVQVLPITVRDQAEPNVVSYYARCEGSPVGLILRLVHGYNMPMCMKIKEFQVEPIERVKSQDALPIQVWRVISLTGDTSIWITTMIRSGDFATTPVDICSMAFPRVDIPDDPNWIPQGLSLADFKHPIQTLKVFFRARWNASRTDSLTFLRLRQPAWASEELLTYVSRSASFAVTRENEALVIRDVLAGHAAMLKELQRWRTVPQKETRLP